jgi:hypothetical protein
VRSTKWPDSSDAGSILMNEGRDSLRSFPRQY